MDESVKMQGRGIVELIVAATGKEKRNNHELIRQLIRSVYFLVRNHILHATTFESLIALQIDNGNGRLESHLNVCPANATYMSTITVAELLKSISQFIKEQILDQLKSSPYFSLMADESTDIASKEELSVCARWLENGKAVEHFLGTVNAHEVHAEALTQYLLQFLSDNGIPLSI